MKRGIVMSIHESHAVVMTTDGQFLRAPLQGSPRIGEEVVFEEEAVQQRRRPLNRRIYQYAGAAAMLCLLVISGLVYAFQASNPVVAYLTMDINPSVEIGVDGKERVRQLRALNDDGARIIENISYKGKDVETVAAAILEEASRSHYLDAPHKEILIASILLTGDKSFEMEFEALLKGKLDQKLQQWLAEHASEVQDVTISTLSVPEEIREEADANGVSSGKMAVYLMAKDEGYEGDLAELKEKSIDVWAEPIGGVQSIVATEPEDAATTKKKLQELLAKEQKEKEKKKAAAESAANVKPSTSTAPIASPAVKPSTKPTSKPTASPKPSKGNGKKEDDDDKEKDEDDDDDRNNGKQENGGKKNNGNKNNEQNIKNTNNKGQTGDRDDDDREDDDSGKEKDDDRDDDNSLNNWKGWNDWSNWSGDRDNERWDNDRSQNRDNDDDEDDDDDDDDDDDNDQKNTGRDRN